jgi:hypothetical protein
MPVTAQSSSAFTGYGVTLLDTRDQADKAWLRTFTFTQSGAGDQNSTANLCYLPRGKHRVLLGSSYLSWPAMTNGAIRLGHTGYTQPDGTAVAADDDAFMAATTTTGAGQAAFAGAGTVGAYADYHAAGDLTLQAKFSGTGGIADGASIKGYVAGIRG